MGIRVNFTDVASSNSYEPVPTGKYNVFVTDGEIKESGPNSKNPGSQYINWEMTIDGGNYDGRKLWTNTSLLPQALFGLKGLLAAAGLNADGELDFDIKDVIGKKIRAKVIKKPADGSYDERNEIKAFYAAGLEDDESDNSLLP